jgi:hypothetical protein
MRDGSEFFGRRIPLRSLALREAEELRRDLERNGWLNVDA